MTIILLLGKPVRAWYHCKSSLRARRPAVRKMLGRCGLCLAARRTGRFF